MGRPLQDHEGGELRETGHAQDGAAHDAEERGDQGSTPVYRPEEAVEESRHGHVSGNHERIARGGESKQVFVSESVARRGGGVAIDDEPVAGDDGQPSGYEGEQVEDAGHPGDQSWRQVRYASRHFSPPISP